LIMTSTAHLWAIGFDDMERAAQVRDEAAKLAKRHCLDLIDAAVAVRYGDGTLTVDGERFMSPIHIPGHSCARLFAGLLLGAPPLTATALGCLPGGIGSVPATAVGIGDDFVCAVEHLIKPGTSALFVLDKAGDSPELFEGIKGLGGTLLKTSVDLERAQRIQAALSARSRDTTP
jgi:uncharacterized membrane protein